jgi:hypothetical protein
VEHCSLEMIFYLKSCQAWRLHSADLNIKGSAFILSMIFIITRRKTIGLDDPGVDLVVFLIIEKDISTP